jgi:hypothetical protein
VSDEQEVVGRFDLEIVDVTLVIFEIGISQVGIGFRVGERDKTTQTETGAGIFI